MQLVRAAIAATHARTERIWSPMGQGNGSGGSRDGPRTRRCLGDDPAGNLIVSLIGHHEARSLDGPFTFQCRSVIRPRELDRALVQAACRMGTVNSCRNEWSMPGRRASN